jgi:RNase P/RNase MRP subunit p29
VLFCQYIKVDMRRGILLIVINEKKNIIEIKTKGKFWIFLKTSKVCNFKLKDQGVSLILTKNYGVSRPPQKKKKKKKFYVFLKKKTVIIFSLVHLLIIYRWCANCLCRIKF